MADNNKIDRAAVRAIKEYIDKCPKLECIISMDDMNPFWDGDIIIYRDGNHNISSFLSRIPFVVKGTTNFSTGKYQIKRKHIEAFRSLGGGLFFWVFMTDQEPQFFYNIMSVEYSDILLAQKIETIGIDLKEMPEGHNQFEKELIDYVEKTKDKSENFGQDTQFIKRLQKDCQILKESISTTETLDNLSLSFFNRVMRFNGKDPLHFIRCIQGILDFASYKNIEYNLELLTLLTDFASFLKVQREDKLAEQYFNNAFSYAIKMIFNEDFRDKINDVLNRLIVPYKYANDLEFIEKTYLELIGKFMESCKTDPINNVLPLADIHSNLADFYEEHNRHYKSVCNYVNALNLYYFLVDSNEEDYFRKVIDVLWNLYKIHKSLRKIQDAKQDNTDALSFIKNQAIIDRARLLAESAFILKNNKEYKKAEEDYRKSLEFFTKKEVIIEKANVMASLADVFIELGKNDAAKKLFDKSIKIFRRHVGRRNNGEIEIKASFAKVYYLYAKMFAKIANIEKQIFILKRQ